MADLHAFLIESGSALEEALSRLEQGVVSVLFVTSGTNLLGALTDGDARRGVLRGLTREDSVDLAMNKNVVYTTTEESQEARALKFAKGVTAVPLTNNQGQIVEILQQPWSALYPISKPNISQADLESVNATLRSAWISSIAPTVSQFEDDFSVFTGIRNCLAVSNGTLALVLALQTLGIGPGDEVIVPNVTFGATANAVIQVGATPKLIDISREDWGLDPNRIVIGKQTRAIIAVHLYGYEAHISEIAEIARRHSIVLIEDCAEALGTRRHDGQHVGTFGDAATFSFFANKVITTGEGGMACFRNDSDAANARIIRGHGLSPTRKYWHQQHGNNYRLTGMQAALGITQLARLDSMLHLRQRVAENYTQALGAAKITGLELPVYKNDTWTRSVWLYTLLLPVSIDRDYVISAMAERGIECRPVFAPLHQQPPFESYALGPLFYPSSDTIFSRGLSLPTFPNLTSNEARWIASQLIQVLEPLEELSSAHD